MNQNCNTYSSFEDLPLVLNATQLASVLNISRANAYNLLHRRDFPTLHVGCRMMVTRDHLFRWLDRQSNHPGMSILSTDNA